MDQLSIMRYKKQFTPLSEIFRSSIMVYSEEEPNVKMGLMEVVLLFPPVLDLKISENFMLQFGQKAIMSFNRNLFIQVGICVESNTKYSTIPTIDKDIDIKVNSEELMALIMRALRVLEGLGIMSLTGIPAFFEESEPLEEDDEYYDEVGEDEEEDMEGY